MPAQSDQLAVTAARNGVGRVIQSCRWQEGRKEEHIAEKQRIFFQSMHTETTIQLQKAAYASTQLRGPCMSVNGHDDI